MVSALHTTPCAVITAVCKHGSAALVLSTVTSQVDFKNCVRTALAASEEVRLFLERDHILRDGECLWADDGRVVVVLRTGDGLEEIIRFIEKHGMLRAQEAA